MGENPPENDFITLTCESKVRNALNAGCDLVLLCNQCVVDDGAPIDALIDGMTEALLRNEWAINEESAYRRLNLLPKAPGIEWDALMVDPIYMHALSKLP